MAEQIDRRRLLQLLTRAVNANPERLEVLMWVLTEWDAYADDKWDNARQAHEESMRADGWRHPNDDRALQHGRDPFWNRQVNNYLDRAAAKGCDPGGRQAAAKAATTLLDGLACMIRHHGHLPEGGHPSGEIVETT